tara:strand:+ start:146 stop:607 length:462 start_codon:yes stop_codon:yes gene_type:complete
MNVKFKDKISSDFVDIQVDLPEVYQDSTFYSRKGEIEWELGMTMCRWGVDSFMYDLLQLSLDVTVEDNNTQISQELTFDVKKEFSKFQVTHLFSISRSFFKNGELVEEKLFEDLIELEINQEPHTADGKRSQIFVKRVELNLSKENKNLILTI